MDIRIGVPVRAEDGQAGRVERIILHPDTREVDSIVSVQGWLLPRDVVIPIERVMTANESGVFVRGTAEEIGNLEPFAQSQYTTPPEDWLPSDGAAPDIYLLPASPYAVGAFAPPATQPLPPDHEVEDLLPGDVDVSGTTTVYCLDGVGGRVDSVITDGDSDVVTHLVIQRTGGHDVAAPVAKIGRIDEEGVHLELTQDQLAALPPFTH